MSIHSVVRSGACAGLISAILLSSWLSRPLPPDLLRPPATGLVLLDRAGLPLRSTRAADGALRRWVPLADMDPDLLAAFLVVEDRRFYRHAGVDPRALARAALADLRARRIVAGGSTITMQLARLLLPTPRTWRGKVSQALWALRIERRLSKQAILEQYLNRVPLGQGAVGVEAAAVLYFGAHAAELSLGQAALLAGLARAPSGDNPLVAPRRARARRAVALDRLVANGFATPSTAERARAEPVLARASGAFLAPHFTTLVAEWQDRAEAGMPAAGAVRTSLDLPLQLQLEAEVRHTVETLADRGASQAAAVVVDNASGEILAWVGSPDFWADTAGQVDMVMSPRQPGSALKPFLYALAFDRGYTPASILPDIARVYQTSTGPYRPRNYDRRFHGPVRAREALASSYNLPAVHLADRLGVGSLLHVLREAGFTSLGRSAEYYGLGLALGNGDVTLLELANGYRALGNAGVWRPWRWRAAAPGELPEPGHRIASARSAALVLDILDDPVARIPGFGVETPLDFPFPVAAKTGTSRHFTDNWAVAVTGGFTVAVWVGNFSGRPMDGVSGVSGAGPLLHRAVLATAARHAPGVLAAPEGAGAVAVRICRLSGLRATARCPSAVEWFAPGTAPAATCDWHEAQGVRLPAEFAEWAQEQGGLPAAAVSAPAPSVAGSSPAAGTDSRSVSAPESGRFRILSPQEGDVYRVPAGVDPRYATVALRAAGGSAGRGVRWTVDGRPQRSARWALERGPHRIRAVDRGGEAAEVGVRVE
ncbi:MAG TPA: penicillin-binding protein 1C [Gemmatimonadales bacterium]|nr:penicillin-binding protein 1C [Gemmatimonadales bacterium]